MINQLFGNDSINKFRSIFDNRSFIESAVERNDIGFNWEQLAWVHAIIGDISVNYDDKKTLLVIRLAQDCLRITFWDKQFKKEDKIIWEITPENINAQDYVTLHNTLCTYLNTLGAEATKHWMIQLFASVLLRLTVEQSSKLLGFLSMLKPNVEEDIPSQPIHLDDKVEIFNPEAHSKDDIPTPNPGDVIFTLEGWKAVNEDGSLSDTSTPQY